MTGGVSGGSNAPQGLPPPTNAGADKNKANDKNTQRLDSGGKGGTQALEGADGLNQSQVVDGRQDKGGQSGNQDGEATENLKSMIVSDMKKIDKETEKLEKDLQNLARQLGGQKSTSSGSAFTGDVVTIAQPSTGSVPVTSMQYDDDVTYSGSDGGSKTSGGSDDLPMSIPTGDGQANFEDLFSTPPGSGDPDSNTTPSQDSAYNAGSMIAVPNKNIFAAAALLEIGVLGEQYADNQVAFDAKNVNLENQMNNHMSTVSTHLAQDGANEANKEAAKIVKDGKLQQAMAIVNLILTVVTLGAFAVEAQAAEQVVKEAIDEATEKAAQDSASKGASQETANQSASTGADSSTTGSSQSSLKTEDNDGTSGAGSGSSAGGEGSDGIETENELSEEGPEGGDGAAGGADSLTGQLEEQDAVNSSRATRDSSDEAEQKTESTEKSRAQDTKKLAGDKGAADTQLATQKLLRGIRMLANAAMFVTAGLSSDVKSQQANIEQKSGDIQAIAQIVGKSLGYSSDQIKRLDNLTSTAVKDLASTLSTVIQAVAAIGALTSQNTLKG